MPVFRRIPNIAGALHNPYRRIGVKVNQRRRPDVSLRVIRRSIDNCHSVINPAFFAVPYCGCRLRGMEADSNAGLRISGKRGERRACDKFVTACLVVFRNQPVILKDFRQFRKFCAVFSNEAVKHGTSRKDIHAFTAPCTADFQTPEGLRERDPKVHIRQRDLPFIIFQLFSVVRGVHHVRFHQLAEHSLFIFTKSDNVCRCNVNNHICLLFIRFSSVLKGLVCKFSRPRTQGRRLQLARHSRRRIPSRHKSGA